MPASPSGSGCDSVSGRDSESMNRHSPPNSSTCTSGSLNGVRDAYTSGRQTASTSSPATAHHAPHSRPTSPANDEHGAAAEHRRHQQRAAEAAQPGPGGEHQRQPGQERRA